MYGALQIVLRRCISLLYRLSAHQAHLVSNMRRCPVLINVRVGFLLPVIVLNTGGVTMSLSTLGLAYKIPECPALFMLPTRSMMTAAFLASPVPSVSATMCTLNGPDDEDDEELDETAKFTNLELHLLLVMTSKIARSSLSGMSCKILYAS
jgi:hypothetical protein